MKLIAKVMLVCCHMDYRNLGTGPANLQRNGTTDGERAGDDRHPTEPIRFVDISTDKIAGDQPINNTIRLKPKEAGHEDGEVLAIVTIVTERYRTQYALLYTTRMQEAVTDKEVQPMEMTAYRTRRCRSPPRTCTALPGRWLSPARYRNVNRRQHRMTMRLNNIYAVGDFFFLDFSIENRTNIRFDIDENPRQIGGQEGVESHQLTSYRTGAGDEIGAT